MIVYEVNLKVRTGIKEEYNAWLKGHVRQLLNFQGFKKAEILHEDEEKDGFFFVSVHYYVETLEDLDNYFENHAPGMRQDGVDKFGDQFTATRRILKIVEEF